jgi:hypothetical protein
MTYNWFLIFNTADFDALGLISKTYTLNLEGVGEKDILVTKGISYGITYEGIFLSLSLNDENPFEFEDHAIFLDVATDNVYLGIAIDES